MKRRDLAVLVGEIHTKNHHKSLIKTLPQLDQQGFVIALELSRDFNPLIQHFMRKASQIYEKANEHKLDMQEAEKRVDRLEAKLLYKMTKRNPALLSPYEMEKYYFKRDTNQWYLVEKRTGAKDTGEIGPIKGMPNYADVIREAVKHNVLNHGNLQVYAVDISTKELKEQAKKGNLFLRIGLPESCQQPIEEYLKKARKSALLEKSPKESLKKKLAEALQKEGIFLHDSQDLFLKQLDSIAKMQRRDKSLVVRCYQKLGDIDSGNIIIEADMNPEFLNYRDQRMSGTLELKKDHKYGPCSIKKVAETRSFYYPGPRLIHWGGAYHLGEWKTRNTDLSKELKKVGFPYVVTADAYTGELRNYPTDFVFESHKGLQKAITHGIQIQTKSQMRYPLSLSDGKKQKEKDTSKEKVP
ncbi:hypothetical protein A7K73_08565 [Candidatus Methylacidiphilum fumarolicum]|uniref:hypothetical protein n=1 Tax=Candidatus Methylacidiphilum fumarolicum TaxID=591154 RepID=UPI0010697432|nr:hypothetical protein [Candidatus Methylacidiphilum fumarolicum]TFE67758.1 hypothetical protein A7K73_08565 [Candidatus Methylacidiphilum fumarolicum]TFE72128.1 hypothetical protein A7K72_09435 [Candidatus Methylacidiphilum fumarolicum]